MKYVFINKAGKETIHDMSALERKSFTKDSNGDYNCGDCDHCKFGTDGYCSIPYGYAINDLAMIKKY